MGVRERHRCLSARSMCPSRLLRSVQVIMVMTRLINHLGCAGLVTGTISSAVSHAGFTQSTKR